MSDCQHHSVIVKCVGCRHYVEPCDEMMFEVCLSLFWNNLMHLDMDRQWF